MSTPASAYSRSAPNVGMRALNADSTIRGRFGNVKGLDRTNAASARWRAIEVNAPSMSSRTRVSTGSGVSPSASAGFLKLQLVDHVGRVPEDGHALGNRNSILEELDAFRRQ